MERRTTPRRDWAIGKDDVGRAVLEWKIGSEHDDPGSVDPCARTYDFLNRLDVPDLKLEEDVASRGRSCNPYDHRPDWAWRSKWRSD
jgi:hypothetical protein